MEPAIQIEPTTDASSLIASRTIAFELYIGAPGWRRKIRPEDLEPEAEVDLALIAATKAVIDRGAMKGLNADARAFKTYLDRNHRIPCGLLRGGMMLVGVGSIVEVDRAATAFVEKRRARVESDVIARYPVLIAEAERRLGTLFKRSEYPTVEELREMFLVRTNWLALDLPRALEQADAAVFKRQQERSELEWKAALDEIRNGFRAVLLELTQRLASRLQPDEDGKKKILRASAVERVEEFLRAFDNRNITDDADLAALVEKARAVLAGTDAEAIRSSDTVRERVRAGMEEITTQLETMVEAAPRRRFARPRSDEDLG